MAKELELVLDRGKCQGHGRCFVLAPDIVTDDDDGFGVVAKALIGPDDLGSAQLVMSSCPEAAISLKPIDG